MSYYQKHTGDPTRQQEGKQSLCGVMEVISYRQSFYLYSLHKSNVKWGILVMKGVLGSILKGLGS